MAVEGLLLLEMPRDVHLIQDNSIAHTWFPCLDLRPEVGQLTPRGPGCWAVTHGKHISYRVTWKEK